MQLQNIYKQIAGVFLLVFIFAVTGCKIKYSTTGASIGPDVKTFSVDYFQNRAPIVVSTLSQTFTEGLKDKFLSQTTLDLTNSKGDLHFEGDIADYRTEPQAIQEGDVAALNRLTITIKVRFTNAKDPKFDFDTSFSRYADYPSSQDLTSVQDKLIDEIVEELINDVFNKSVVNW